MVKVYTVQPLTSINYGATGIEAILQNVETALVTMLYDQPMARGMAWEAPIDRPIQVVQMQIMPAIAEGIEEYEPRVRVVDVDVDVDHTEGRYKAKVKVVIRDDEQSV